MRLRSSKPLFDVLFQRRFRFRRGRVQPLFRRNGLRLQTLAMRPGQMFRLSRSLFNCAGGRFNPFRNLRVGLARALAQPLSRLFELLQQSRDALAQFCEPLILLRDLRCPSMCDPVGQVVRHLL